MPDEVKDILASVSADIDQAQATIDETRGEFPNDLSLQKQLDVKEFELDVQRTRVKNMRAINEVLDNP